MSSNAASHQYRDLSILLFVLFSFSISSVFVHEAPFQTLHVSNTQFTTESVDTCPLTFTNPYPLSSLDFLNSRLRFRGPSPKELWVYQMDFGVGYSVPVLSEVDNDGKLEIIFGSRDKKVYALNAEDGSLLWAHPTDSVVDSSPSLGNLDDDSRLEVVFSSHDGQIYALHAENGSLLWTSPTDGIMDSSPVLVDVNSDSKLEVLIGGSEHDVYALHGENGTQLWRYNTGSAQSWVDSSPVLGNLDGDSRLELVIASGDHNVYALNAEDGTKLWNYTMSAAALSSPVLGDLDNDEMLEVIVGDSEGIVYALNAEDGTKLWDNTIVGGGLLASPALADIDSDKKLEIIINSWDGGVYILNAEDGSELLHIPFEHSSYFLFPRSSPTLGDIDQDNMLEILVGGIDGKLHALNAEDGSELWEYNLWGLVLSSPILADIDNDTYLEVIIGIQGFPGKLIALDLERTGSRVYWEGFRGTTNYSRTTNLFDIDGDIDFLSDYSENIIGTSRWDNDTDNDSMLDGWEVNFDLDPFSDSRLLDPDTDELTNMQEYHLNTNPKNNDSDNDGMDDGWEVNNGFDPLNASDAKTDVDEDGLTNFLEYFLGTNVTNSDSDGDGLIDGLEYHQFETDPLNPDSDGDGINDGLEVSFGYNPNYNDTDNDGISDYDEHFNLNTLATESDTDQDGIEDGQEIELNLDPKNPDTDGDGDWDGEELGKFLLDPINPILNKNTRLLILFGIPSGGLLGFALAISYLSIYIPRRQRIRRRLKQVWFKITAKPPPGEEEIIDYAKKAQEVMKTMDKKQERFD